MRKQRKPRRRAKPLPPRLRGDRRMVDLPTARMRIWMGTPKYRVAEIFGISVKTLNSVLASGR
jgi:hypothetical protein